jgi:hypothetical protein
MIGCFGAFLQEPLMACLQIDGCEPSKRSNNRRMGNPVQTLLSAG